MSFTYTAICTDRAGQVHNAHGIGADLYIDNVKMPFDCGGALGLRVYCTAANLPVAIWNSGATGLATYCVVGQSAPVVLDFTYGNNPVAAFLEGQILTLIYLRDGLHYNVRQLDANGGFLADSFGYTTPRPFASQGIRDMVPVGDGTWNFSWFDENLYRQCGPYLLANWRESARFVAGSANNNPPEVGVYVWDKIAQTLQTVSAGNSSPIPVQVAESPDLNWVAISGDQSSDVSSDEWHQYVPTPIQLPPITPFTSPKLVAVYPMSNGALTTHSVGMNSRIVFGEPHGFLDPYPDAATSEPLSIWVDTEAGDVIPSGACTVYCDISRVATVAPTLAPWQVLAFPCYPNPSESSASFDARIHDAIGRVIPDQYMLVAGAWNRGTLTDQEVLDGLSVVYQNATRIMCLGVAIFGLDRGTSIGQFKPLYQQCADLFSSPQGRPTFPVRPPIPPTPPGLAAILKRKAMPMSYPPLAGFTKRQFQPDHEGNGNLNLVVTNPLPVAYDSGPPAGTVLPPARGNITPAQVAGKCLLCVDPGGHWSAMPFGWTTDGIGTYGWWKLDGNLASVAPRGEGDQAFTFPVGD